MNTLPLPIRKSSLVLTGVVTLLALLAIGLTLIGLGWIAQNYSDQVALTHAGFRSTIWGFYFAFGAAYAAPLLPLALVAYHFMQKRFGPTIMLSLAIGVTTALCTSSALNLYFNSATFGRNILLLTKQALVLGGTSGVIFHVLLLRLWRDPWG